MLMQCSLRQLKGTSFALEALKLTCHFLLQNVVYFLDQLIELSRLAVKTLINDCVSIDAELNTDNTRKVVDIN